MIFSAKKLDDWLRQRAIEELFPEQGQASPHQELPIDGNHITPVSHRLEA